MPLRDHAVVVEPQRWKRPKLELARLLVPITGSEAGALAQVLERGPMTVEGDLSHDDAQALVQRLGAMGIPARIEQTGAPQFAPSDGSDGADGLLAMPGARPAAEDEKPVRSLKVPRPVVKDDAVGNTRRTFVNAKSMSAEMPEAGWGALFPDLAADTPKPAKPEKPALPPSLDDLIGGDDDEAEHAPPALVPESLRDTLPPKTAAHRAKLPVDVTGSAAEPTPPLERELYPPKPPAHTRPATSSPRTGREPSPQKRPESFDGGSLISDLVGSTEERAPYAPTGFDPRPEHQPVAAALLSALAPGAGQIFNGDSDRALDYGLKFFLIKPWIDSVRDARAKAEKIASYWAPRPEPGTLWRALRYAGAWWLCVGLVVTLVVWTIEISSNITERTPEPTIGPQEWARAVEEAQIDALGARVAALDAVHLASQEIEEEPPFTMTDEERAERLFVLGYVECRTRHLRMCEEMMKRVSDLKPGHSRALKLQAWASLGQRGMRDAPMPDVGVVPTLSDIEMRELRQEMALEGEALPPEREVPQGTTNQ